MTGLQPTIATGRSVVAQAQSRPSRTWRRSQSAGRPTWRYRTGNPERLPALSSLPPTPRPNRSAAISTGCRSGLRSHSVMVAAGLDDTSGDFTDVLALVRPALTPIVAAHIR